jgi:prophage maintenance system killer protein
LEGILDSVKYKSDILQLDVAETAACYYLHFTKSQALLNGNKRLGVIFTHLFLLLNNHQLTLAWYELKDLSLLIATDDITPINQMEKTLQSIFKVIVVKEGA